MVKKMADGIISNPQYQNNTPHLFLTQKFSRFPEIKPQEDDINPIIKAPIPSWREEISSSIDPKLTLTPERPTKFLTNSQCNPSIVVKTKVKQKQKVRFEIDNEIDSSDERNTPESVTLRSNSPSKSIPQKAYCPQMYTSKPNQNTNDDELDVTQTEEEIITISKHSNSVKTSEFYSDDRTNSRSSSADLSFTETALKYLTFRESENSKDVDPPNIVDSVPLHVQKCHTVKNVIVTREYENRQSPSDYQFPFVDHTLTVETEHVLARPEFNSTLKLSEELKDLKASKPQVSLTLKQKLISSEETRTDINEKASVKVNRSGELFTDLVGVDPDINKLCLEVERQVPIKSKSKTRKSASKICGSGVKTDPKAPDILEFYTDDRQCEIPDLTLNNITIATENLSTADPSSAFDLYRHNRIWESLYN